MSRLSLDAQNSRLARRLLWMLVLSALVPILAGTLLAMHSYALDRAAREQAAWRIQAGNYGMALIGRLVGYGDSLVALAASEAAHPAQLLAAAHHLPWAADEQLLAGPAAAEGLDARQRAALAGGSATLRVQALPGQPARVILLQPVETGGVLAVQVSPEALWHDIGDFAAGGALRVRDARGQLLAQGDGRENAGGGGLERAAAWSAFLGGSFSAPAWTVELWRPREGLAAFLSGTQLWLLVTGIGTAVLIALLATRLIRRELQPFGQLVRAAQRISGHDFSTPVAAGRADDEFGQLARAFNAMSDSLRRDFAILSSLAEVDRQLLRSPTLEPILDTLLPRIATVLGARAVSVVLLDPDAPGHVRAFEHFAGQRGPTRVRRLQVAEDELRSLGPGRGAAICAMPGTEAASLLAPLHGAGSAILRCHPLEQQDRLFGFLCTGYESEPHEDGASGGSLHDFADRLGVVLANLEQTRQLRHAAHFDPLTGLANRQLFAEELDRAVAQAGASRRQCALLYLDLDEFKHVNDTAGHAAGDELLRGVAERLQQVIGPEDLAARLGGDEFAILVRAVQGEAALRGLCQRLQHALAEPIFAGKRHHQIYTSIGVALAPDDGGSAAQLLMHGDIAIYRAKETGRGRVAFFESSMQERMQTRVALETGLQRALAADGLCVHYQPIVRGNQRGLCAVEALARWPGGRGAAARSPAEFIPVAEESGLIVELGAWVLRTALRDFAAWRRAGLQLEYVSVNVSAGQMRHEGFEALVEATLREHQLPPAALQIEVAESVLVEGDAAGVLLGRLAARGVRLALDDFGTGYSSLNYLRRFPVHAIKIDKSFVDELPDNRAACRLVEAMLAMAAAVDVHAIAEGVENARQAAFLNAAGCHALQGYLFAKAMPANELPTAAQRMLGGQDARLPLSA